MYHYEGNGTSGNCCSRPCVKKPSRSGTSSRHYNTKLKPRWDVHLSGRRFRYSKIVLFVAESDHLSDEYRKAVEREACYTVQCDLRLGRDGFGLKRRPWRGLLDGGQGCADCCACAKAV